jgi:hypothetical protein
MNSRRATRSIFYADSESDCGQPINATKIEKVAEAGDAAEMGETAEWEGAVDDVDEKAPAR